MYARTERDERSRDDTVATLRARLERVQGRRLDHQVLPIPSALGALLPGGGLRAGSAYSLVSAGAPSGAMSLLLAMLARPSQEGGWCAVVGMPELGIEAAESLGVDLSHLVLIPDPGPRWLAIVATLAEVFAVVAVRPPALVTETEASRLAARLRDRQAILLVQGPWPQSEATLHTAEPEWSGVGNGHGYLSGRALTVAVSGRRSSTPRHTRVLLPDVRGGIAGDRVPAPVVAMREVG